MKALLRKYLGEVVESEEIVDLPENYDGNPYGDTVPFCVASNWLLLVIDADTPDPNSGRQTPEPAIPTSYNMNYLESSIRFKHLDYDTNHADQEKWERDMSRANQITQALQALVGDTADHEQLNLLSSCGFHLPFHPAPVASVAPAGTVLHCAGMFVDAFPTDNGSLGLAITPSHPDDDSDPRFKDVFIAPFQGGKRPDPQG